jgi:hypothetical protein
MGASRIAGVVPGLICAVLCALLAAPAAAKNPYKAKSLRADLAADTGIDVSTIRNTRVARCAKVDPANLTYQHGDVSAPYSDCLVVELADAWRLFYYHQPMLEKAPGDGWKELLVIKPGQVRGATVVATGKNTVFRQIQVELLDGHVYTISYSGGLLGDNKYPLVAIKQLEALGMPITLGIAYVMPYIRPSRTITIY